MKNEVSDDKTFPVGKVMGLHGLEGVLKIRPQTNNPSLLLNIKTVEIIPIKGERISAQVRSIKFEKRMILLSLKEYPDRTSVEWLVGTTVITERAQLKNLDDDEWWATDLIGLQVFTTDGALVGTISDIVGQAGDYLEIRKASDPDGETALVPFVRDLVPTVDLAAGKIEVVNLPGLID